MLLSPQEQSRKWFLLRLKIYASLFVLAGIAIAGVYLAAKTDFFQLREIEISGLERLPKQEVLAILRPEIVKNFWGRWLGINNYLSWSRNLSAANPLIVLISVEKNLFKKQVHLEVKELALSEVWCLVDKEKTRDCYWLDDQGVVMSAAPYPEGHLVKVVFAKNTAQPIAGNSLLNSQAFTALKTALEAIRNINIMIDEYVYDAALQEFLAKTAPGGQLRFSTRFPLSATIAPALKEIVEDKSFRSVDYIDLTVEGRLFVKQK